MFCGTVVREHQTMMPARWILVPSLMLGCMWAQAPQKPRCNAQHSGELWPPHPASGSCRPIEMCTLNVWKYRWEPLTVHVSQLAKDPRRRVKCEAAETRVAPAIDPAGQGAAASAPMSETGTR